METVSARERPGPGGAVWGLRTLPSVEVGLQPRYDSSSQLTDFLPRKSIYMVAILKNDGKKDLKFIIMMMQGLLQIA